MLTVPHRTLLCVAEELIANQIHHILLSSVFVLNVGGCQSVRCCRFSPGNTFPFMPQILHRQRSNDCSSRLGDV